MILNETFDSQIVRLEDTKKREKKMTNSCKEASKRVGINPSQQLQKGTLKDSTFESKLNEK